MGIRNYVLSMIPLTSKVPSPARSVHPHSSRFQVPDVTRTRPPCGSSCPVPSLRCRSTPRRPDSFLYQDESLYHLRPHPSPLGPWVDGKGHLVSSVVPSVPPSDLHLLLVPGPDLATQPLLAPASCLTTQPLLPHPSLPSPRVGDSHT